MPISRNAFGTVFVVGALGLTLAALAYPTLLGVQNTRRTRPASSPTPATGR